MLDEKPVEVQAYGQTIHDLRALERYLTGLGIHKEVDRLGHYIRDIERLENAVQTGSVSAIVARSGTRELAASLHEGTILADVAEHLKGIDPARLVPLLRAILKGHPDPAMEKSTQRKNKARNVLFHLQVGAKFHEHGAEIWYPERLEDNPDVLAIRDSWKILTECKRPDSQDTIERNIAEASRQLTNELNTRNDACSWRDRHLDRARTQPIPRHPRLHWQTRLRRRGEALLEDRVVVQAVLQEDPRHANHWRSVSLGNAGADRAASRTRDRSAD